MSEPRLLGLADTILHKALDPYINAKLFGHHLPGWGRIQYWQWLVCNAYANAADRP